MSVLVRPCRDADAEAVNAVARAAFAQYANDYEDWPGFIEGIGRMAGLAKDADVLVAEQDGVVAGAPVVGLHTSPIMASALRMYEAAGFVRDRDLPPIRGVPYGRYVLAAPAFEAAHVILGARFPM